MLLRLHRFLPFTRAEGPGARAALWVQGCPIRCPGCFNPGTWSATGGEAVEVAELAERLAGIGGIGGIEGVTFLGGEPFEQAEALAALGGTVRERGLSVMTFSGYTMEKIEASSRPGWRDLLAVTDLLVDGPYVRPLTDTSRPWVGSSNQRFRFLTSRYRHLEDRLGELPNRLEVRLHPDGRVLMNGLAPVEMVEDLAGHMAGEANTRKGAGR